MNKPLYLTAAECSHILRLLQFNEMSGDYVGNRVRYWQTAGSIKEKIQEYIRQPEEQTPCATAGDVVR